MKINIKNLTFKCIIGILPFEREKKQKVVINVSFNYKFKKNEFINYADIVNVLESSMKKKKFLLIEDALIYLKKEIKTNYKIKKLTISITKPNIIDNCEVSVTN